jgi:hypothetical protein
MSAVPQLTPVSDARLFLARIFGEDLGGGLIEVRAWPADRPQGAARRFCRSVAEAEHVVGQLSRQRLNVCIGIATRRSAENGKKSNLCSLRALWADVDGLVDQGAREELEVKLEGFPLRPSFRIWSGGGEHLYWTLREPIDVSTPNGVAAAERKLVGLQRALGADPSATDASRVMRCPGTVNFPDAGKRAKGRLPSLCVAIQGLR